MSKWLFDQFLGVIRTIQWSRYSCRLQQSVVATIRVGLTRSSPKPSVATTHRSTNEMNELFEVVALATCTADWHRIIACSSARIAIGISADVIQRHQVTRRLSTQMLYLIGDDSDHPACCRPPCRWPPTCMFNDGSVVGQLHRRIKTHGACREGFLWANGGSNDLARKATRKWREIWQMRTVVDESLARHMSGF